MPDPGPAGSGPGRPDSGRGTAGPLRYPIPARTHRTEETLRRSRFVTTLGHAANRREAHAFVARREAEFPDATHHCWAFVAGPPGSTAQVGMSDAGEPAGTAGRPILTALLHGGVGEVVAVVTRYYGGVKLGRGGLGRAYAGGVQTALATLPLAEKVHRRTVELRFAYAHVDAVFRLLDEVEGQRGDERFGADVRIRVSVPEDRITHLRARLAAVTAGQGVVRTLPLPDG